MNKTQNSKLKTQNLLSRPPIVVVMGHVDHGKTTLLSYIRKSAMPKEPGEITQSIGAYEITHPSASSGQVRKITFIDTPGHEAFSKMRARGAKVADLAILVVAADDSVKPQTKESIEILKSSKTPFIVAINKIDKPNADIERVKNDLMKNDVLLEGSGGNVSWQAISAKTGEGVNELLDLILLVAELENLTYDPDAKASGVIIESKMDSRRGIVAVGIIKNGSLKTGELIATATAKGKIKILENFLGERTEELKPSSPALIFGFETLPQVGEEFMHPNSAPPTFGLRQSESAHPNNWHPNPEAIPSGCYGAGSAPPAAALITQERPSKPVLHLILKADVSGSLEALSEIIKNLLSQDFLIKIVNASVGEITDGDVKSAQLSDAVIIGFKTKAAKAAENLARSQNVKIIFSEIIYELVKKIEQELENIKTPKTLGEIEILAIFDQKGKKQIIGGGVISGAVRNKMRVRILRGENELGFGRIMNLQKQKQDAPQANEGEECGILFESDITIQAGDRLMVS
jgi:translation initiation factor IF-2